MFELFRLALLQDRLFRNINPNRHEWNFCLQTFRCNDLLLLFCYDITSHRRKYRYQCWVDAELFHSFMKDWPKSEFMPISISSKNKMTFASFYLIFSSWFHTIQNCCFVVCWFQRWNKIESQTKYFRSHFSSPFLFSCSNRPILPLIARFPNDESLLSR